MDILQKRLPNPCLTRSRRRYWAFVLPLQMAICDRLAIHVGWTNRNSDMEVLCKDLCSFNLSTKYLWLFHGQFRWRKTVERPMTNIPAPQTSGKTFASLEVVGLAIISLLIIVHYPQSTDALIISMTL